MAKLKDKNDFWSDEKKQLYENAMDILMHHIEKIDEEIYRKSKNHIVRHIEKRLKSEESILEKINRKSKNNNDGNVEKTIHDLAGVRVICFDTRQVYLLVKEIKKTTKYKVVKEKDYISHPKESGYQSYHVLLDFSGVKVELQVRTILMDAWSSLETVLIYKKTDNPSKDILEKINKFSKWSKKMDRMVEEMLEVRG